MRHTVYGTLRAAVLLLILLVLPVSGSARGADSAASAKNGVVRILCLTVEEGAVSGASLGSGFGVGTAGQETDVFLTNRHVVEEESGDVSENVYILLDDHAFVMDFDEWMNFEKFEIDYDRMVKCEVLYAPDGYPDLAVLRAEAKIPGRKALSLMKSEEAGDGSPVYAIGYPSAADGLDAYERTDDGRYIQYTPAGVRSSTITSGVIERFTKLMWRGNTQIIQHSAHINHGNSGGPLVTASGAAIGINTYGYGSEEDRQYNLAIYADYAMEQLDRLGLAYSVYEETTPEPAPAPAAARQEPETPPKPETLPQSASSGGTAADTRREEEPEAETPAPDSSGIPTDIAAPVTAAPSNTAQTGSDGTQPRRTALEQAISDGQARSAGRSRRILNAVRIAAALACAGIAVIAGVLFLRGRRPEDPLSGYGESFDPAEAAAAVPQAAQPPRPEDTLRLQCVSGTWAPRRFALTNPTRIGRDPAYNDLIYPKDTKGISGVHCQLLFENGALYLQDLNSTYGTWYRGSRLAPMEKVRLQAGDDFCLGQPDERFRICLSGQQ